MTLYYIILNIKNHGLVQYGKVEDLTESVVKGLRSASDEVTNNTNAIGLGRSWTNEWISTKLTRIFPIVGLELVEF